MNLILASWKIQWDVWHVRMLVLLSFTLQIILFVFDKRRKNMPSQWINVIVWLAYITADSVATFALSKLSCAQNNIPNPTNALQALWAPLLLLHLGGPDTITAYSLEDNQLWIRHFFSMSVQATVAIYVIVMSWRHFWFSFMLIPAFMAGIIKYGERTWALKLACRDKSGGIVPFGSSNGLAHIREGAVSSPGSILKEERDEYVLVTARQLVKDFKRYIENYDIGRFDFKPHPWHDEILTFLNEKKQDADKYFGDVLEVEIGLMYDLLYTKAPMTFTKRGCIFRSISFMCTVSVLVGLFRLIAMEAKWNELHYSMVDIVITGVLLVGALALEIYAVILLLFSDWAMLWLINCGRGKWTIRLWQKFPWFFEKKKWSKKMGQINLFEEEDKRSKWSRILESLGIQDKFYSGSCTTSVCIPPTLYPMIVQFIRSATDADISIDLGSLERFFGSTAFDDQIIIMHIITDICYHYDGTHTSQNSANSSGRHDDKETCKTPTSLSKYMMMTDICCRCDDTCTSENTANSCGHDDDKETCKTLSHYMMHLLLTCRWLLPVVVSDSKLDYLIACARLFISVMKTQEDEEGRNPSDMIKKLIKGPTSVRFEEGNIQQGAKLRFVEAMDFFYKDVIIKLVVDKGNKEVKWEKLKILWLAMLCYAAISCPKNYHLQKLREGGELLNLVWFLIPQSQIFCGVNTFALNGFFNKYFQSMPDVGRARPKNNKGGFSRSYTV